MISGELAGGYHNVDKLEQRHRSYFPQFRCH